MCVFVGLGEGVEAFAALHEASQLFPENSSLHLVAAQLLHSNNQLFEAEREYLLAIAARPSDPAWFALARLYVAERRYDDAVRCVEESIKYAQAPYDRLRSLGQLYLTMNQPQRALQTFQRADRVSPYHDDSRNLGRIFNARLAEGKARAYGALQDLPHAVVQQELAVSFTPEDRAAWLALAEFYQAQGNQAQAAAARQRASALPLDSLEAVSPATQPR